MMSNLRHSHPEPVDARRLADRGGPVVRSYAVAHPSGTVIPPQPAGWDQLLYAASGVMTVLTDVGRWVAPPSRAVWVPSGSAVRIEITGRTRLRNLYVSAGVLAMPARPLVLDVTALLRELILRAVLRAPLWADRPDHERLLAVIGDELAALPTAPLDLPMPQDPRALVVADALLAGAGTRRSIESLSTAAGASRRTIERRFQLETHMSLGRWRGRLRVLSALEMLGGGATVTEVARRLGYSSPSAFVTMFRRETGTTPTRYFRASATVMS